MVATANSVDEGDKMNQIHGYQLPHDSDTCDADNGQPCFMCRWADETEKRHTAERKAEEERLEVVNAS